MSVDSMLTETYTSFVKETEERLLQALVARFGPEEGREATAEAFAYGWEHWERIRVMDNPAGYLYRVGQRKGIRSWKRPVLPTPPPHADHMFEPGLPAALAKLSQRQRTAVVLVQGLGWTQEEVATFMGVSASTVRNHISRGMQKLRHSLGGDT